MSVEIDRTEGVGPTVERVIVGLAGSRQGDALIDISATFARALRATLKGIYVREQQLLDLAELPFTVTTGPGVHTSRTLNANTIEQAWKREEASYRDAILQRAGVDQIACSFETASGNVEICLQESVTSSDIVVLASEARGPTTHAHPQGLLALSRAAHGVLVVSSKQARLRSGPVLVIDEGGAIGKGLVRLAAQIAEATLRPLEIVAAIRHSDSQSTQRHASSLAQTLHNLEHAGVKSLRELIRGPVPSLLVTDLHLGSSQDELEVLALLHRFEMPTLFFTGQKM